MRLEQAKTTASELKDFYSLGTDCLWITAVDGYLWWAFAEEEVVWLGGPGLEHGVRIRKVRGTWCNLDLRGDPLWLTELGAGLTRPIEQDQMISHVEVPDKLVQRINKIESALLVQARDARRTMIAAAREMIAELDWSDFVVLIEMIFSRSGWRRVSRLTDPGEEVDLTLEEPATMRTALAQVRLRADQSMVNLGMRHFSALGHDEMFFVCYSPVGVLNEGGRESLHIWTRDRLADVTIRAGLYDWLMSRSI